MPYLSSDLKQRVREHFQNCCAYCLSPQRLIPVTFEFDHIVPQSDGGATTFENLCLACPSCNSYKHDAVSAPDPETGDLATLFHPQQDQWQAHFAWNEANTLLLGQTPSARATIIKLRINRPALVELRDLWVDFGYFPPKLESP
jgi:HNH endonuclease